MRWRAPVRPNVYGRYPALAPLTVDEVERRVRAGAELIDVRPMEAFAEGHIPGSPSIALRPSFASWRRAAVFVGGPDGWARRTGRPLARG